MRLTTHPTADAFLGEASELLERREAEHSLLLGTALALRAQPARPGIYLATVRDVAGIAGAALMVPPHPLLLAVEAADPEPVLDSFARDLLRSGRGIEAALVPDPIAEHFVGAWHRTAGATASVGMRQRLHQLARVRPVRAVPGRLRVATAADLDLVADWALAFNREALGEAAPEQARRGAEHRIAAREVFLWEDSEPRVMAARARPTRRTVTINGVYTPPALRGRGYATACVAELSRRLLRERPRCVLFTDLANPTSNGIYARIGYRPVLDFTLFHLAPVARASRGPIHSPNNPDL